MLSVFTLRLDRRHLAVAKIVNTLEKHDAMDYSIVLSSTASEPASLQYIAPYAGTAISRIFHASGKRCA